eukprot:8017029-Pyramimonas_sp.AAC.1
MLASWGRGPWRPRRARETVLEQSCGLLDARRMLPGPVYCYIGRLGPERTPRAPQEGPKRTAGEPQERAPAGERPRPPAPRGL